MNRAFFHSPKSIKFILNFLMLYFLVACGGGAKEKTEAKIQIFSGVAQLAVANADGGLVLWGRNDRGDHFSRVIDSSSGTVELTLRNGTWVFSSMAWHGNAGPYNFEGTVRCGISQPTQLTGADLDLGLNLTNATCNQAPFLGPGTMNGTGTKSFPNFRPFNCQKLPTSFTSGTNCDDTPSDTNRGHIGSYRVEVRSFDVMAGNFSSRPGLLQSRCMRVSASSPNGSKAEIDPSNNLVDLNLPLGNGTIQLAFRIVGFYGNESCDVTGTIRGAKEFIFDRGFGINNSQVAFWTGTTSQEFLHVFLKSTDPEVCVGNNLSASPFAAGSGTATHPYVVCTPAQFNTISSAYLTSHFRIGQDLDFQLGSFTSVGGTANATNPVAFQKNFLGNGHQLSNIKIEVPASPTAHTTYGIIRALDSGAVVNNLTLKNVSVLGHSAADYLGIVSGKISHMAASNVSLSNIFVIDSKVIGRNYLGLIFGYGNGANSFNIHGIGNVQGNQAVGGLVGKFISTNSISIASFKGEINSTSHQVGGIIGNISGSGTYELMRSEGRVEGLYSVGGLVGHINSSPATVQDSYSIASVRGNDPSNSRAGGLIGQGIASSSLLRSFHTIGTVSGVNSGGCVGTSNTLIMTNTFFTGFDNNECPNNLTHAQVRSNSTTNPATNPTLGSITNSTSSTGIIWFKPGSDNNYDFPQLFWEKSLELSKLPYLKRNCSGYFSGSSSGKGTGNATDPYWICSAQQFNSMNVTNYYKLMSHIDLSPYPNDDTGSGTKISNVPNIDGNGFRITNLTSSFSSTLPMTIAYFGSLGSSRTLKNLIFDDPAFNYTYTDTSNTSGVHISMILAINSGTIDNVVINGGQMNIGGQFSLANGTSLSHLVGMMTAYNSGTVKNSRINGKINYTSTLFNTSLASDYLLMGGITASNYGGVIEKCFAGHEFNKTGLMYFDNFSYGHIAGESSNNGQIKTSKAVGLAKQFVGGSITLAPTNHYVGGIVGKNSSSLVENTSSFVKFDIDAIAPYSISATVGGLVGYNFDALIKKSFYQQMGSNNNNFYSGIIRGGLIGVDNNSGANSYQDLFCFDGSTTANKFGTSTGLNYGNYGTHSDIMEDGISFLPKCMTTLTSKSFSSGVLSLSDSGNSISYQTDPNNFLIGTSSSAPWIYTGGEEFLTLKEVY